MPELRAEVENGPWPQDPEEVCDLVMKDGVAGASSTSSAGRANGL